MAQEDWKDLDARVSARLSSTPAGERMLFTAGVAERLMCLHEALPSGDQAEFTLSLRPLLKAVWNAAFGDSTAFVEIKQGLAAYYLSDFCHNDGQDGPPDADDPAAAAVLFAAEMYLHGCADFAIWVSTRAVESVDELFNQGDTYAADPDGVLAAELSRQLHDLDRIAAYATELRGASLGLRADASARLREALYGPLSAPTRVRHVTTIDVGPVRDERQLHEVLARELGFPAFYGHNWDAFWDAITGLVELPDHLRFIGWAQLVDTVPRGAAMLEAQLHRYRSEYRSELTVETVLGRSAGELGAVARRTR